MTGDNNFVQVGKELQVTFLPYLLFKYAPDRDGCKRREEGKLGHILGEDKGLQK